jgi:hypothetical protein
LLRKLNFNAPAATLDELDEILEGLQAYSFKNLPKPMATLARTFLMASVFTLLVVSSTARAGNFEIEASRNCSNMGTMASPIYGLFVGGASVVVPDWHELDERTVLSLLEQARVAALDACIGINPKVQGVEASIRARNAPINPVLTAWWKLGEWHIDFSRIPHFRQRETDAAAEQLRREAAERNKAEEAKLLNERTQAALADCGPKPAISGRPSFSWLSSTYDIAARDAARAGIFFCVKTIQYLSAAPNPFGGNAARARFIGYSKEEVVPYSEVRDFAY